MSERATAAGDEEGFWTFDPFQQELDACFHARGDPWPAPSAGLHFDADQHRLFQSTSQLFALGNLGGMQSMRSACSLSPACTRCARRSRKGDQH
jgi:hypothetical protein